MGGGGAGGGSTFLWASIPSRPCCRNVVIVMTKDATGREEHWGCADPAIAHPVMEAKLKNAVRCGSFEGKAGMRPIHDLVTVL